MIIRVNRTYYRKRNQKQSYATKDKEINPEIVRIRKYE